MFLFKIISQVVNFPLFSFQYVLLLLKSEDIAFLVSFFCSFNNQSLHKFVLDQICPLRVNIVERLCQNELRPGLELFIIFLHGFTPVFTIGF